MPEPKSSSATIWPSWRMLDPNSRRVWSFLAAASNSELVLVMMVVSCSRVSAPPSSEVIRNALDSASAADFIRSPLPSAIAALLFTRSATGPWPLPSPRKDPDSLSRIPRTRSNSMGDLVCDRPMVSCSCRVGPPR
ncbi:Uncharacterised protein [Mycobacteroides abscessus subsp. abscessus]|nr:Uncharacterised protein [Mycobacteroides abscessus subsp. abscessus]